MASLVSLALIKTKIYASKQTELKSILTIDFPKPIFIHNRSFKRMQNIIRKYVNNNKRVLSEFLRGIQVEGTQAIVKSFLVDKNTVLPQAESRPLARPRRAPPSTSKTGQVMCIFSTVFLAFFSICRLICR